MALYGPREMTAVSALSMMPSTARLGERLLVAGLLTEDKLMVALQQQKQSKKFLGEILLDYQYITPQDLLPILSQMTGVPYVDLSQKILEPDVVMRLPKDFCQKHRLILMEETRESLDVAMADPEDLLTLDAIHQHLQTPAYIRPFHATPQHIGEAIELYYPSDDELDHAHVTIVRLVSLIIAQAVRMGASDIHLQPTPREVIVKYRLDGVLTQVRALHKDQWMAMSVRLKIMANLDIAESRRPQGGSFTITFAHRPIDFRLSIHPTVDGENIVIRILDKAKSLMTLQDLGFCTEKEAVLCQLVRNPQGLIIVNGPTGSGKTTTLYALLDLMDAQTRNIMTLEDPIEYRLPNIRQTEIRYGLTFADGIRSLLRQDPDVIFISEIRDTETAQMAVRAAMTGHLVLATLHAGDNTHVPARLIDLGISPLLLAGTLKACLSQRLLRRTCASCHGLGCPDCFESGYKKRIAISDLLLIDDEIASIVSAGGDCLTLTTLMKKRRHSGLSEDADVLIAKHLTTVEEKERVLGR